MLIKRLATKTHVLLKFPILQAEIVLCTAQSFWDVQISNEEYEHIQDFIFDFFRQVDSSSKRKIGACGIGAQEVKMRQKTTL